MTAKTIRRLLGVTYWVINDREEIRRFINTNVKGEWEQDNLTDGVDSRTDEWLLSLPKRQWCLRILETSEVRTNSQMMADETFTAELTRRSREMRRGISEYHAVIWPLVIRAEDNELQDGYCRYTTLRSMGIDKAMAYVGSIHDR